MVTMYGAIPTVKAASLTNVKDVLSTSNPNATSTHNIVFTSGVVVGNGGYYEIAMDPEQSRFGAIDAGNVTCANGVAGVASTTATSTVRCTYAGGLAIGTSTTEITGVNNPAAGYYLITITTYNSSGTELETAQAAVYIIDSVAVTAHVDATLNFSVGGLNNGDIVNGVAVTEDSTSTSTPFGTLSLTSSSTVGQLLAVSTNAKYGYTVTVQKTDDLKSAAGATINSFNNALDGSGTTTPQAWTAPAGTLGADHTYGHFGLTSSDTSIVGGPNYAGSAYVGLVGANPIAIMGHNGPVNAATDGIGTTSVAYTAQISGLQEAGDYQTTMIYVCTPTY